MPSSLFGPNSPIPVQTPSSSNPEPDAISVAEAELKQSGGNAKTAFYNLAKKKGVDTESVLEQVRSLGDLNKLVPTMMAKNSRLGPLFRLFSGMK